MKRQGGSEKKLVRRGSTRPAANRIIRIDQLLLNKEYPNGTDMATEFEVSIRTVMRDVEYMKEVMKRPIEFDPRRNGYYYSGPVDPLPAMPLSEQELFALLVAGKAVSQYHGTPFEQPLKLAFERLTGLLNKTVKFTVGSVDGVLSFHPFAPEDADLRVFETITQALMKRRELTFGYRNHGAQGSQKRRVQPYHIACIQNVWYLLGFDVQRQGMRTFALVRMTRPALLAQRFEKPKNFNSNDYLAGSFSVFKGGHDYEVVVELDAWAADEVRGRRWHRSQELTELPGGLLRIRMRLNDLAEVEKWVLSMGSHATVVRPEALRDRLAAVGRDLIARYGEGREK